VPGGGHRLQQPVHVDDLADAIVACLDRPATIGRAYDLAGPEPLTFREVIAAAGAAVGRRPRVVPVPLGPAVAALRVAERVLPDPRLRAEQLERLAEDKAFPIDAARRDLGFDPRPFAAGIAEEAALLR
jgi:nucleoside-diphosphate-sugar epimerase